MKPPPHPREQERLNELRGYGILDTEREADFDELVQLASELCDVPVSVVNFVDEGRQWFKAETGLGVRSTPIDTSLCGHAILEGDFVEIPDTLADPRMADNPLCKDEPGFRFYAGAILKGATGLPIGTFCILDHKPRRLTLAQRRVLQVLARHVMRELNLRQSLKREKTLRREVDHRVKNSLASIGAVLSVKARRTESAEVRAALEDVCVRIRSLSSMHAELYQAEEGQRVSLSNLFNRIAKDLQQLLPDDVELLIHVHSADVQPEFANSLLLIVNEFISNSIKHGLNDSSGMIEIEIDVYETSWRMICADNGTGDERAAERAAGGAGLGSQVIRSIAQSLGASIIWQAREPGLSLTLSGLFELRSDPS